MCVWVCICARVCGCTCSCRPCVWTLAHMGRAMEGRRVWRRWERGPMPNKLTISLSPFISLSQHQTTNSFIRHLCSQWPPDPAGPRPFTLLNSMFWEKLMIGKWLLFFILVLFHISASEMFPLLMFSLSVFLFFSSISLNQCHKNPTSQAIWNGQPEAGVSDPEGPKTLNSQIC